MAENVKGQNRSTEESNQQAHSGTHNDTGSSSDDRQNASANEGGLKDMRGDGTGTSSFGNSRAGTGSGLTTKQGVSGSDYDGQAS